MNFVKLLARNALRHKLRTALTVLGIAISILAFGMLRTVVDAWYVGVEAASANRLVTRNAVSIIFPLPLAYKDKIRQVSGVTDVSWGNWFGGIYKDEKNFFANFAVDTPTYLKLYPEYVVPHNQEAATIENRKGCIVGVKLAKRFGWHLGDVITLKGTIFPGDWDFVITGMYKGRYKTTDETQMLFSWDYLNETMKKTTPSRADQVGFYMIGIKNADDAASISQTIDRMFKNSIAETLTETEKAFNLGFIAMSEAIVVAIQLVSFVVIIIIMAVAANTMAMTARERIGEYAVLKAMGFGSGHLAFLIFGESMFISLLGCAVGMAATYPAAHAFAASLSQYFPIFNVATKTLYMDAAAACVVGVVAGIFPAWRASTLSVAEGLRRIG
jgi:putative ABC transport system permease protein